MKVDRRSRPDCSLERRTRSVVSLAALTAANAVISVASAQTRVNRIVLANEILDRWQAVAVQAAAESPAWREVFSTQLESMDVAILRGIARVRPENADGPATSYERFTQAVRSAVLQSYMTGESGKTHGKLASTTTDQIFVPIVPCRIVDTRSAQGMIAAGATRNYNFYANAGNFSFIGQGGTPGPAGSACPGTVNPNGGAPSAAVVTVTVVSPSAAGNYVLWGGANPIPTISALNWNAGNITANTTVIPSGGRSGTGPGGSIADFAVSYNGASGSAHFVADVVGYLVENRATPLDCAVTASTSTIVSSNAGTTSLLATPCSVGWTLVGGTCDSTATNGLVSLLRSHSTGSFSQAQWTCAYNEFGAQSETIFASSICCRVPGR